MCRERTIERVEMFKMAKVLCGTCGKFTDYTSNSRIAIHKTRGKEIVFHEKYATCSCCGNEYNFPGFADENKKEIERIYNGLKGCGLL